MNRLLKYKEAADYLNVAEKTLRNWVCQRKIGYVKFGKAKSAKVRFRPEDLDKHIQDNLIDPIGG